MLLGYEGITVELSDLEKETVAPLIKKGLRLRVGSEQAITGKEICSAVNKKLAEKGISYKLTGVRLRKVISYIRADESERLYSEPVFISSSGKGYFRSTSSEEMTKCIMSLQQRIRQQQFIVNNLVECRRRINEDKHSSQSELIFRETWQ